MSQPRNHKMADSKMQDNNDGSKWRPIHDGQVCDTGADLEVEIDSPAEILVQGLKPRGSPIIDVKHNQDGTSRFTNKDVHMFLFWFGTSHDVLANIWCDLQTTDVEAALVKKEEGATLPDFLMTCHFLTHVSDEEVMKALFDKESLKDVWHWVQFFVEKLIALRADFRVDGEILSCAAANLIFKRMKKYHCVGTPMGPDNIMGKMCEQAVIVICQYELDSLYIQSTRDWSTK